MEVELLSRKPALNIIPCANCFIVADDHVMLLIAMILFFRRGHETLDRIRSAMMMTLRT
jgi:hypothetical protein